MKLIKIKTTQREEFLDITPQIEKVVKEENVERGLCLIFSPHTTCGLTINENADPSVRKDLLSHLKKLIPPDGRYSHSEGNADAHIKASLIGSSLTVLIERSSLVLGTWQGIYFCEFDGPRQRQIYVKVIKEVKDA